MSEFENLLQENILQLQRYVKFKINNIHDAEDIIQDVCLSATENFESLKNPFAFRAWLIGIARHKCNDYYRKKQKNIYISLESLPESALSTGRFGIVKQDIVRDTMDVIGEKEKQILQLYFFENLSHKDIASRLSLPIGTVKSRLYYAKDKFRQHYTYHKTSQQESEGEMIMKRLPEILPEYKIEKMDKTPFDVVHEELPGMFVIPRMGEKISFGMYDMPSRTQTGIYKLSVTGKIVLHGIEGVSIQKIYTENEITEETTVFAKLTDTYCKYLGGMYYDKDACQKIITFLDDDFDDCFGIGEDNCGFPTKRKAQGRISQDGEELLMPVEKDISDIVGRFNITLNNNVYETIRLIDYENGNQGEMLCEYYIDKNGRTILWRRFNKNDWANKRYKKLWTEMLPDNERLIVNGETYVHWYDCITDYIL